MYNVNSRKSFKNCRDNNQVKCVKTEIALKKKPQKRENWTSLPITNETLTPREENTNWSVQII